MIWMGDEFHAPDRSWRQKFSDAFRGWALGVRDQRSFRVHFAMAALVLAMAAVLPLDRVDWCLLILCISSVLTAEMFNTALEHLAKAVDRSHNRHVGNALDIGSAAVLTAAFCASAVGAILFIARLIQWWQG
jgi:diacylglycerol kinase